MFRKDGMLLKEGSEVWSSLPGNYNLSFICYIFFRTCFHFSNWVSVFPYIEWSKWNINQRVFYLIINDILKDA
jgi:hypothetical protein